MDNENWKRMIEINLVGFLSKFLEVRDFVKHWPGYFIHHTCFDSDGDDTRYDDRNGLTGQG